jgi:hypothetical protein
MKKFFAFKFTVVCRVVTGEILVLFEYGSQYLPAKRGGIVLKGSDYGVL